MDRKICFLFGHSTVSVDLSPHIEKAIERHIQNHNALDFYIGYHGSFDQYAATAARRAKARYPEIRLFLLRSYHPAERPVVLPDGFDGSFYPPLEKVPRQYAIVRANRYMLAAADSVICYVHHVGNSRKLLELARRREKKGEIVLENLAENFSANLSENH